MRIQLRLIFAVLVAGCASEPLEPWHTADLDEEFTASKAADVRDFDGYLALEHRLFEQLMIEVYALTERGPEFALVRYSRGSAADPETWDTNYNRTFELETANPRGGVLLLHGMSDSPYSLRALGQTLNQNGFWVIGLRLPGHGTAPSGLKRVRWLDMASAVRIAMARLEDRVGGRPLHIAGYSTGAALALNYSLDAVEDSRERIPDSLILISPAIGITSAAALARPKAALGRAPGLSRLGYTQIMPEFDPFRYNSFATNAGAQVHSLTRSVSNRIATLENDGLVNKMPPMLIFKSAVDATVSNDAVVDRLLTRLAGNGNELVLFDINRSAAISALLVADPAPFTERMTSGQPLPFTLRLITNESPESRAIVERVLPENAPDADTTQKLGMEWPIGIISLSHIALPFTPEDPLYGATRPDGVKLFLGQPAIRGERDLFRLSSDWLIRLRYNPFYSLVESGVLNWLEPYNNQQ